MSNMTDAAKPMSAEHERAFRADHAGHGTPLCWGCIILATLDAAREEAREARALLGEARQTLSASDRWERGPDGLMRIVRPAPDLPARIDRFLGTGAEKKGGAA